MNPTAPRRSTDSDLDPARQQAVRAGRRRAQRRRRTARRLDLAIGVLVALALIVLGPGLAMIGILAVLILILVGVFSLLERRRSRRAARPSRRRARDDGGA